MGTSGQLKVALQNETGTQIFVSKQKECYPGTRLRLVVVGGNLPDNVLRALDKIIERLVRCGEQERSTGQRRGGLAAGGESDFLGKEAGEYALRAALATKTASAIIGPGGSTVQSIRRKTGTKLSFESASFMAHQLLKVIGTQEKLRSAIRAIEHYMRADSEKDWYPGWAAVREIDGRDQQPVQAWYECWASAAAGSGGSAASGGPSEGRGRSRSPRRGGGGAASGGAGSFAGGHGSRQEAGGSGSSRPAPGPSKGRGRGTGSDAPKGRPQAAEGGGGATGQGMSPDVNQSLLQMICSMCKEDPICGTILDENHTITCELPADRADAMQGLMGEHLVQVERDTGALIRFEDVSDPDADGPLRCLVIEAPLLEAYRAHALMMKRYHEVEATLRLQLEQQAKAVAEGSANAMLQDWGGRADGGEEAGEMAQAGAQLDENQVVAIRNELADLELRLQLVRNLKQADQQKGADKQYAPAAPGPKPPGPVQVPPAARTMQPRTVPPRPSSVRPVEVSAAPGPRPVGPVTVPPRQAAGVPPPRGPSLGVAALPSPSQAELAMPRPAGLTLPARPSSVRVLQEPAPRASLLSKAAAFGCGGKASGKGADVGKGTGKGRGF